MNDISNLYSTDELLKTYQDMVFLRRFEEQVGKLYGQGDIGGFCHLYIGQEAVILGVKSALTHEKDAMVTSYRDHAHAIMSGSDPKAIMAELTGKSTGISKGKGGSMHMFDLDNHFYGGHGIVGAQVPIGTGIAFAMKYKKIDAICATFFGDGSVHQGQVYESFNMARLWNLPILYIIENNKYAMGTSIERSSSIMELHKRAEGFNIEHSSANGMDIFSVKKAAVKAIEYIRETKLPYVLEFETYRYKGHSISDPAKYRTKEEVNEYKESDPILHLKNHLMSNNLIDDATIKTVELSVKNEVNECISFAHNSPVPDEKELWTDIYSN